MRSRAYLTLRLASRRLRREFRSPVAEIIKIEIAGSNRTHRESANTKNFGMNQATSERAKVKSASAITTPTVIGINHDDFSAGQEFLLNQSACALFRMTGPQVHPASVGSDGRIPQGS